MGLQLEWEHFKDELSTQFGGRFQDKLSKHFFALGTKYFSDPHAVAGSAWQAGQAQVNLWKSSGYPKAIPGQFSGEPIPGDTPRLDIRLGTLSARGIPRQLIE